jgi:hypothetical protein
MLQLRRKEILKLPWQTQTQTQTQTQEEEEEAITAGKQEIYRITLHWTLHVSHILRVAWPQRE